MSWSFAENVLHLEFDALWTTAVALLLLILGYGLRRKLRFFETFCIPAPVIGGLIMAIVALILHHNGGATIKFFAPFTGLWADAPGAVPASPGAVRSPVVEIERKATKTDEEEAAPAADLKL